MVVSLQTSETLGVLYDALYKQYKNPDDPKTLKSLEKHFLIHEDDSGFSTE